MHAGHLMRSRCVAVAFGMLQLRQCAATIRKFLVRTPGSATVNAADDRIPHQSAAAAMSAAIIVVTMLSSDGVITRRMPVQRSSAV